MEYPERMEQALHVLCDHCNSGTGPSCDQSGCLVGFSQKCLDHYKEGNGPMIADGLAQLPVRDMKVYDWDDAAQVIAIACNWCHGCNEDHSEDCVVSLCRRAMEFGITGDEITYKGNSLIYLKELGDINPEFCGLVLDKYKKS